MPRTPRHSGSLTRSIFDALWQQPLWAIPFALFFGALFAHDAAGWIKIYEISLIFAYCIRAGLLVIAWVILPPLLGACRGLPETSPRRVITVSLSYVGGAVLSSFGAALIVNATLLPGFIGGPRSLLIALMYSALFSVLFTGINYARVFYVESVVRTRAEVQARAELARAELRALRAQVNPHFLFNTLNSIAALIAENPAAAEDMTTRLAETFRYTLATSERSHAPLGDELAFVRSCLEIERTRFGDRLRIEEAIEPGLDSVPVPTLLLQPVVENAVLHGAGARLEGGTVRISARRDGEHIVLEVADDGPGLDGAGQPGGGFGLRSVRERLALAGPPHAVHIESAPGAGTRVRITLPMHPAPTTDAGTDTQGDHA
jgi:signal transduction histidine kinase